MTQPQGGEVALPPGTFIMWGRGDNRETFTPLTSGSAVDLTPPTTTATGWPTASAPRGQ